MSRPCSTASRGETVPTALSLPAHRDLYYGGRWHAPQAGGYAEITSPGSGESLGRAAEATAADVDAAVASARAGFREWARVLPSERAKIMKRIAAILHEHAEANKHKNSGLAVLLAGHAGGTKTGLHTRVRGTIGDLYLTLAEEILKTPLKNGIPKRNCVSDQRGSGETRCQDAFETCSQ